MRALVMALIMLSFLQATFIPVDLVLMALVLRSFIKVESANLYLAFAFGLFVSHLSFMPLGVVSIIYLIFTQVTHLMTKSALSAHPLSVTAVAVSFTLFNSWTTSFMRGVTPSFWPDVLIITLICLPLYMLVRFWEERFIVKDIKLKI